jgi:hypothetical protein
MEKEIDLKVKARFNGEFCDCDTKKISCQFHFRLNPGIHCVLHNVALAREPNQANRMGRTFRCKECIEKFGGIPNVINIQIIGAEKLIEKLTKITKEINSVWIDTGTGLPEHNQFLDLSEIDYDKLKGFIVDLINKRF